MSKRQIDLSQHYPKIFEVFAPMNKEYVQLIREHHNVALDNKYSKDYISQHQQETKKKIMEMKKAYVEKAKAVVSAIKEEFTEKLEIKELTDAQKLYNITLWTSIMGTATPTELKELYHENKGNVDFLKLLNAEFRKRDNDAEVQRVQNEIAHADSGKFAELENVNHSLTTIAHMENYPESLSISGFANLKLRTIDKDLVTYPNLEPRGNAYRPIFDLKEGA